MRATSYRKAPVRNTSTLSNEVSARRHKPDYWILILSLLLTVLGLIVVYSISPALSADKGGTGVQYITRQLIAIGIGLGLFALMASTPLKVWRSLSMPLLVAAGVATLITLILPVNADYPAHRWIRLGGFSFQSVELLKFALLFWLAGFLTYRMDRNQLGSFDKTIKPLLLALTGIGLVVAGLQSDLGSAAVIVAIMGGMLFVSGVPLKPLVLIAAVVLIGATIFIGTSDYRRDRFATFMNPEADCTTTGYQACQALIAVGSGGMAGLGLGNSVQAYGYLPEAENDSIFAIYAEKFGFIGVAVLLGILLALYSRIKQVADRAPDAYSQLVVMGIFVWLTTQALINIGAMVGLLPLKGITLPLVSYGGSSVLVVLAILGVVFQVSRYTDLSSARTAKFASNREGSNYENSRDRRRVGRAYHPSARSRN
jgi:cell division protein FtsW